MYRGFRDLDCYRQGRELRILISQIAKQFPSHERFLLRSQLVGSSRSICRNIAEGYGRFTYADTRNFFTIARGSVTETMENLMTAFDENYLTKDQQQLADEKCETVFKLINGYINYLDKSVQRNRKPNP
jgi:four helix bundle protein